MRHRGWLAYLALGALGGTAYYFFPFVHKSGPFFNLLGATSVVAILVGLHLHKPERRLPWILFAIGQTLFISGDVITYNYAKFFHHEIPFPSIGDVFYLCVYPCLIAGILILVRRRTPGRDRDSLIDSLIVTVGVGLLSWEFLIAPYARDYTLSLPVKLVSMAYPMMDMLLLAVVVRLSVGAGRRAPAFYLLVFGALALLATDSAYGVYQLSGAIYQNGGPLEAGWLSFYLLWGAAALHPSMRALTESPSRQEPKFTRIRLALLAGGTLMAPAVLATQFARGESLDIPLIVAGSVALFSLAIARMRGLVRKHELAEARERALRQAGASFVGATGWDALYDAAIRATLELVGPHGEVRLALAREPGEELAVVASVGEGQARDPLGGRWTEHAAGVIGVSSLPEEIRDRLGERRVVELLAPAAADRDVLQMPDWVGAVTIAPLHIGDQLRGLLIVGNEKQLPQQIHDGVDTLASQIALALESAFLTEDLHRRKSEVRFASLVQNSSDVMTIIEADSTIRYQSPSVQRVMGYDPQSLIGTKLFDMIHPEDLPRMVNLLSQILDDPVVHPEALEFRWLHRDGTWLHVETLLSDLSLHPEVGGIVLNTRDVSERKLFEQQLAHQAFHDSVTGLANRALFRDRVEHALERQQRDDRPVAVLFMDIDDFKTINDSLGHAAGDELLAEVGERLRGCLRAADTAARLGGDEFGVLLEDAGYERAAEVAERVMHVLEGPFHLENKEVFVRASLGIAIGDDDRKGMKGAQELLRNADVAMYTAKSQGKARYQVFERAMHTAVLERLELKADLQRAVEAGEFILYYQPVIVLRTGAVSGVEALVRWQHPERGLIRPMEFIPLAEETGLIVRIGKWILEEACQKGVSLQEKFPQHPPLTMSVNISAHQLQHPGLIDEVRDALRMTRMDAASLVLELTETAMMADAEMAIIKLNQLKEIGVKLAIDDFGTGYSSLNYLRRFPVDILKVDKSFIEQVALGGEQGALTASIIKLAATLQLLPVAEGIETEAQLERLLDLECHLGQGFLFSQPLDSEAIERLLGARTSHLRTPAERTKP
jgi:diguanylate cyclase (GGDEF)-like protein/PAS domain S-box-containing protein